jgi:15-cis-phytoene synthase
VTEQSPEPLPPEVDLALAWCAPKVRAPLSIGFQLDRRLARIVARTTEPMLGQMRLAWWRDALGRPAAERPRGDAVLDAIGAHWAGRETALIAMVDAWEVLVTADILGPADIADFASQRGAFFAGVDDADESSAVMDRIAAAAHRWALADAVTGVGDAGERDLMIEAGLAREVSAVRMPRSLRGLAVLDALALRALRRGGRPLMEGRLASLTALRVAIFSS